LLKDNKHIALWFIIDPLPEGATWLSCDFGQHVQNMLGFVGLQVHLLLQKEGKQKKKRHVGGTQLRVKLFWVRLT